MCGIFGIYAYDDFVPPKALLESMGSAIQHRGPDDFGYHIDGGMAMGMRRLSIIDVAGGHQPLFTRDRQLWLVCNGEIYNFRELRETLATTGHQFLTNSDSEVLLHAYREYGDAFVHKIDGMFGFALWDADRRRLLIGRDRLGIKPLYYADDGRRFVFGSEVKSLLRTPWLQAELQEDNLQQYLELGYSPGPQTLFRSIHKLPPATLVTIEGGARREAVYWQLSGKEANTSHEDMLGEVQTQIRTSVQSQMVSDVPLGAFLSGGLDSTSIVACMADASTRPVKTYSIGFTSGKGAALYNELPYAQMVADRFSTEHHEIVVQPDVASLLPKLIWHLDEPVADSAIFTTYMVSQFAAEGVKVILSGVGGDELFGGYRRYLGERLAHWYLKVPQFFRRHFVERLLEVLPVDRHSWALNYIRLARGFVRSAGEDQLSRYRSYLQVFDPTTIGELTGQKPNQDFDALAAAFSRSRQSDALNKLMDVDIATQMVDDLLLLTDKTTMATSIECRVPFLDTRLVELAFRMPSSLKIKGRNLKYPIKHAFAETLPAELLRRPKRGFGAPIGAWLNAELKPVYRHLLGNDGLVKRQLFDPDTVNSILAKHFTQAEDYTDGIQALANLEVWLRLFVDETPHEDLADELTTLTESTPAP